MSKKAKKSGNKQAVAANQAATATKRKGRLPHVPALPVFFFMIWAWAWLYYGSVLHMGREYSFWVPDSRQMQFMLDCSFPYIRWAGRALLQTYKYPWLGGLLVALMLTSGSWLAGYSLHLRGKWRALRYVPAFIYLATLSYSGINMYFEAETGYILGIPFTVTLALAALALIIRIITCKPFVCTFMPAHDESPRHCYTEIAVCVAMMAAVIVFNESRRPYSRTISELIYLSEDQQWAEMKEVARANAMQSNRPMACFYAISLLHTGEIAQRMYDIRLDYDSLYLYGMDGYHNNATNMYIPEGSLHAGFIQTCMHNCMEIMVMTGPTVRLLKILVKCALLRGEWNLADKYLRILSDVPFEGAFCDKYGAMVRNAVTVESDPEFARIRLTEPIHDSFENMYQQPVFMGYNLSLVEGRSTEALVNSLCVCLYTKLMPQFVDRLGPVVGTTPPDIIADGILLASSKNPGLDAKFPALQYRTSLIQSFMQNMGPYMSDRAGNAYKLFPKYKGYYPYYYFFGNLKATKKGYTGNTTSNSGVN